MTIVSIQRTSNLLLAASQFAIKIGFLATLAVFGITTQAASGYELAFSATLDGASLPPGEKLSGKLAIGQQINGVFIVDSETTRSVPSTIAGTHTHRDLPKQLKFEAPLPLLFNYGFMRIQPNGSKRWSTNESYCEQYAEQTCAVQGQIETVNSDTGQRRTFYVTRFNFQQSSAAVDGTEISADAPLADRMQEIATSVVEKDTIILVTFSDDPNHRVKSASNRKGGAFLKLTVQSMQLTER